MRCHSCGARVQSGTRFCGQCGSALPLAAASTPAGFYPDPSHRAPYRWWTGAAWTMVVSSDGTYPHSAETDWGHAVDAGWLPDPHRVATWRYYDGTGFSDQVSDGAAVWSGPRPPTSPLPADRRDVPSS